MAVTVDATATAAVAGTAATGTISTLTVTASATALLAWLELGGAASSITVKWDNAGTPQPMTLLTTVTNGTHISQLYGLLAPTAGAKNLTAAWTGSVDFVMDAISFQGTATDTLANAFQHAATNTGTGTSGTVTVSGGSAGNISIAGVSSAGTTIASISATGSTGVFTNTTNFAAGGARAPGASSVAWTATMGTGAWAMVGVEVSAPSAAVTITAWHPPTVSF